ncbi:MAG TPA: c-type cytochrome [Stellaceae bacterium]|nr:c-type cytochrome [Stellaceae bacterium]
MGTLFAALGATAAEGQPAAPPPPADVAGTTHVCSSCHGPGGHSISSTFPRLAAQQKDYIERQLKSFRDHTRADPHALTYMWGMAARLSNAQIAGIAAYYASQPAVPGQPDNSPDVAAGKKIFTAGVPAQHVPACNTCHGPEGHGLSAFPRLAGQHRTYIERQLEAFASKERANAIMHENSKNLTEQQIREVAAYVRTLN